jgi:hypothetical protein
VRAVRFKGCRDDPAVQTHGMDPPHVIVSSLPCCNSLYHKQRYLLLYHTW